MKEAGLDIVLAHSIMTMTFLSLNTVENSTILHQLIDVVAFATKICFHLFVTVKGFKGLEIRITLMLELLILFCTGKLLAVQYKYPDGVEGETLL